MLGGRCGAPPVPGVISLTGAEKAKKITDAFVRTVQSQQDVGEDVDFMLF
jgi:hypothetical protein